MRNGGSTLDEDDVDEEYALEDTHPDEDDDDGEDELEEEEPPAKASGSADAEASSKIDDDEAGDEEDPIADILFDILDLMGLEAEIEFEEREDHVRYHIEGTELGVLIGRHGQTLEALQFLVGVINARRGLVDYRVIIDVEGYRERREKQLRELARRSAQRAQRESRKIVLAPMPAGERRVIHMALANHTHVKTYSEGKEPERCVVVSPGGAP
jgi:spoIIIJ-associated protein